uniref:Uncharacterized protein n=1 Tax=Plectus sambesii TaxID=2011161 RepID=A0A914W9G3_9BILA
MTVAACLNQLKKLPSGTENQQSKEKQVRNLSWALCIKMDEVCLDRMKKLSNGTLNPQDKDIQVHNTAWALCIKMDEVCLDQIKKLSNGTLNQQHKDMQMLPSGSEKPPSKEMQVPNITLDKCIEMGVVCLSLMKKLGNGSRKRQSKGMLMQSYAFKAREGEVQGNGTTTLEADSTKGVKISLNWDNACVALTGGEDVRVI